GYFWETIGNLAYPVRYYISKAEVVIAVSKAAANFISFFIDYAPIKIIPNGIDTNRFKPNFDKENKELRILFVSRLVHRKGPHLLVKAFKRVIKRYDKVTLIFAGSGYMRETLEELAMSLNIASKVKFLGDVPDENLPQVYSESDIFVLPSLHAESFGLVLLEAMASGLPVVTTNIGGIPEVLEDGKEGFLVKPDERNIADALIKLLEDKNLREKMGRNGRKKAVEVYDWKNVGEKIEEVYKELL
ncbi:MAG: glycosyltransferase family 4 protein, partial [Candidatus Brockarchaeota archaeon]|nr:glycosyltransferase family 4 protein [Candidatus Brockarchaeota archaeon]